MRTKLTLLLLAAVTLIVHVAPVAAQEIWTGDPIVFTRAEGVDGTDPANMDQITEAVWITRMTGGGSIWNAVTDPLDVFTPCDGPYPSDTEWAIGDIADYAALTYCPFLADCYCACYPFYFLNDNPPGVLHLISEDIYIPIQFQYWTSGGTGGFQYTRGTQGGVPVSASVWSAVKALYK